MANVHLAGLMRYVLDSDPVGDGDDGAEAGCGRYSTAEQSSE